MPINDPVLYYTMDNADIASTTITDRGSGGNNGTLVNSPTTGATGKIAQAVTFNGTSQGIQIGSGGVPSNLSFVNGPFTLAAWINANATQDGIIVGALQGGAERFHLRFHRGGSNVVEFRVVTSTDEGVAESTTTASSMVGSWYHICGVATAGTNGVANSGSMTIYVNGTSQGTATFTPPISSALAIGVAKDSANNGTYFSGSIDEVRIYNRALSSTEVTDLYNFTGSGGSAPLFRRNMNMRTGSRGLLV